MKSKRRGKKIILKQTKPKKTNIKNTSKKSHLPNRKKVRRSSGKHTRNIYFGSPLKMAQNANEEQNEPQPSTSRKATEESRDISTTNQSKTPFVKFKDNKTREDLTQKYKYSAKWKVPYGTYGHNSSSLSQSITKKILNQIKKRNKLLNNRLSMNSSMEKSTSNPEDLDDDCVCIETKPEIILIDDDSAAPVNVVKELELKYIKLKKYDAIGSIRMNEPRDKIRMQIHTSTPNARHSNGKTSSREIFHEDADAKFGSISYDTISTSLEDITIVEDTKGQTNDVIVIDETVTPQRRSFDRRKRKKSHTDDSVIFISENKSASKKSAGSPAQAFIPLDTPAEEVKIRLPPLSPPRPRPKRKCRDNLFTSREEKQLKQYNENTYNPNKESAQDKPQKRMVIVDGSNVAYQHALNKEFSVKGLKICLDYFDKMGHEVKAVVPQYRLQKQRSSDPEELEKLHRAGKIVFTPCKNLPGKSSTSYDDRFVLQLASELDAAVVSNDNYRDLLNENAAFKKIIENRVIGYTWCNDMFILPKDPYGKWGPMLSTILNRS